MRRIFVRIAAPVMFLVAATAVVLIARSALHQAPASTATAAPATTSAQVFRPPARRSYYRLQPGDTLDRVALRYRTTVHQLLLFNPGIQADTLAPGQKIRVR